MRNRYLLVGALLMAAITAPVVAVEPGVGATSSFRIAMDVSPPRVDITPMLRVHRVPERDMEVLMFLGRHTEMTYLDLWKARRRAGSWQAVMDAYRISPVVLYPQFDTNPGPPYGHAWGYWRNKGQGGNTWGVNRRGKQMRWSDRDILDHVRVQNIIAYTGGSPNQVVTDRRTYRSWEKYSHHERSEKARAQAKVGKPGESDKDHGKASDGKGKDKDKNKGKAKNKGKNK